MEKKPWWPVALGLGALVVVGGGGGLVWWKRGAKPAPKSASSATLGAAANEKLKANRGTCPEGMVFVPAGTFTMGSPDGEGKADEHPAHPVKLKGFCVGGTEVTVAQYRECVQEKRNDIQCTPPRTAKSCNWKNPARAKHPVNCVEWKQADEYCKWAGGSLPTEAQWEYAARGADGRKFPWGNNPPTEKLLNGCGAECGDARPGRKTLYDKSDRFLETSPVGSFPDGASPFGAMDMAGNVYEWVADWYAPYQAGPAEDPTGPGSPPAEAYRITRGGNYFIGEVAQVRAAARAPDTPNGGPTVGFRCVHQP